MINWTSMKSNAARIFPVLVEVPLSTITIDFERRLSTRLASRITRKRKRLTSWSVLLVGCDHSLVFCMDAELAAARMAAE